MLKKQSKKKISIHNMQKYIIHHFEEESDCLHWNTIEVVDRSKQNSHAFLAFAFPKPDGLTK